jgi:xanthine/uracil/vitamin C permease (AzgA family)
MDFGAVMTATCVSAALATLLMGLWANYPIAEAPLMGENFFFAISVVGLMKVPWTTALGIVFVSGVLFVGLTLLRVREMILDAVPASLKAAIAAGIGLFIMLVFDTVGTLIGVSEQAGLTMNGRLPRADRAMLADAVGTLAGAVLGTSTVATSRAPAAWPKGRARASPTCSRPHSSCPPCSSRPWWRWSGAGSAWTGSTTTRSRLPW